MVNVVFVVLNRDYSILQTITRAAPLVNLTSCTELRLNSRQPCICHYDTCVGWYPCGLKYCRGKDSAGRIVSYRCGIKTCSRCRQFVFRVATKSLCVWDEADFQPFFVDSPPLRSLDDQLDVHNWDDDDVLVTHFLNETLLHRVELRNSASVLDVAASSHSVNMEQRLVKMGEHEAQVNGQFAKSRALDDDEDVN